MDVNDATHLQYYFEWDRDVLLWLCATIRQVFWPISVFFIHPLVLFVLIRKTRMDLDCKLAFIIHDVVLILFDVYNGYFYQLYTLIPYPVFCCTGIMCNENISHRVLLTVLSFLTISLCAPYLFVMMRLHQKMVSAGSRAKLSKRSQFLLMCLFTTVLVSNVYGFGAWSGEPADREEILKIPDIAWVKTRMHNFLVFGRKYGEIGLFEREMYLLLFSITVCFSFNIGSTYHAVFVIGKENSRTLKSSKTFQIQLRFMVSMAIQACLTSLFFVTPLVTLGLSMATPVAHLIPAATLPLFRTVLVVIFSCCSCGHSVVFLGKSAYIIKKVRGITSKKKSTEAPTVTITHSNSQFRMTTSF